MHCMDSFWNDHISQLCWYFNWCFSNSCVSEWKKIGPSSRPLVKLFKPARAQRLTVKALCNNHSIYPFILTRLGSTWGTSFQKHSQVCLLRGQTPYSTIEKLDNVVTARLSLPLTFRHSLGAPWRYMFCIWNMMLIPTIKVIKEVNHLSSK